MFVSKKMALMIAITSSLAIASAPAIAGTKESSGSGSSVSGGAVTGAIGNHSAGSASTGISDGNVSSAEGDKSGVLTSSNSTLNTTGNSKTAGHAIAGTSTDGSAGGGAHIKTTSSPSHHW